MISPAPDCIVKERTKEDDFIILACDGVWDVLSNDEAVEYVKENVKRQPDLGYLCEAMLDHCLNKNSRDNMTVCIVAFPGRYCLRLFCLTLTLGPPPHPLCQSLIHDLFLAISR